MRALRHGFTLVELLVVILIIGLASSIIVLKTGHFYLSNKHSEVFARELTAMLDLAHDQAIFSSNTIGLRVGADEYHFVWLDNTPDGSKWKVLGDKDIFWQARPIPEEIVITVNVQRPGQQNIFKDDTAPQIIMLPSGEVTPFTISIHKQNSDQIYKITNNNGGKIIMKEAE